jgi:hypothetical protein
VVEKTLSISLDGDLATIDAVVDVDQCARRHAQDIADKGSVFQNS